MSDETLELQDLQVNCPKVSVPLSQFARPFLIDPGAFQKSLQHPLLVWESPPVVMDGVARTYEGVPWDRPTASEPLVFVVRQGRARSHRSIVLGRSLECDISLQDESVSAEHAGLQYQEGTRSWWLIDNTSKNGTWLGPKKLEARAWTELPDRSKLKFGHTELLFFLPGSFVDYLVVRSG